METNSSLWGKYRCIMKKKKRDKIFNIAIIVVILFAVFALAYSVKTAFFNKATNDEETHEHKPSLTEFDKELAKKFMDKNNDGKCDSCGMPVEMCIDSGQMQCDMDSKSTIGVLGTQHIHADFKVYFNGKQLDFSDKDHMSRIVKGLQVSSFIHVDSGAPATEKTGDVLHMHATGVPLWIFFDSIELKLPDNMKMYVNEKEISDYRNYVFNDLDKILITDGAGDLEGQLNSITDFAKVH